jgi:hypothetical protein
MSTDLQKYSTENQLHTIRRYSDEELLALLQAVLDEEGFLSGLIIDERDGISPKADRQRPCGALP